MTIHVDGGAGMHGITTIILLGHSPALSPLKMVLLRLGQLGWVPHGSWMSLGEWATYGDWMPPVDRSVDVALGVEAAWRFDMACKVYLKGHLVFARRTS
jgi:hypothetical protein